MEKNFEKKKVKFQTMDKYELLRQYKHAKKHKEWLLAGVISSFLSKRTADQKCLYGQYLMYMGALEQAEAIFNDTNYNNYFKLSGLFQIAFEKKNWCLANKYITELESDTQVKPFLSAYKIYITKQIQKDLPSIVLPSLTSPSMEYLSRQIDSFDLDRTLGFMNLKVLDNPDCFDFGEANLEELLHMVHSSLVDVPRGNQVNTFAEAPILFDQYQFVNGDTLVEASTIPFTNDLYALKPICVLNQNKPVYTLKR